jgi:hypothetical protein
VMDCFVSGEGRALVGYGRFVSHRDNLMSNSV